MIFGKSGMKPNIRLSIIGGVALMLLLPLGRSWGALISPKIDERLRNIQLCNESDRKLADAQIEGCSALIKDGKEPTLVLAIAHNNRGNAYSVKGDYDRAIQDYDVAIRLDPTYPKPFNNRGLAYQKKGDYDRAIKDFDEAIKLDPKYGYAFANRADTYQKMHESHVQ